MCHKSCIIFAARNLTSDEVKGRYVVEVGSRDVNGSLRPIIKAWGAGRYVGLDIVKGPGVDVVGSAGDMTRVFGQESFDIVISTEVIEHVRDWRETISNIKRVCRPGGTILLTTRSKGYAYHGYPHDFWRYELEDMEKIFSDFDILSLERDTEAPGVFLKARKPSKFEEADLSSVELYSMLLGKRVVGIEGVDPKSLSFLPLTLKEKTKTIIFSAAKRLLKKIYPGLYYGYDSS